MRITPENRKKEAEAGSKPCDIAYINFVARTAKDLQ
jgi:hypothetical protein